MIKQLPVFLLLATVALTGCDKKEKAAAAGPVKLEGEAKQVWDTRCVTCHGTEGGGDGPAGAALDPKPRSFFDAKWQDKVTDAQIRKAIVEGGPAIGLSPLMAPNPDLGEPAKKVVLDKIIAKIRSVRK